MTVQQRVKEIKKFYDDMELELKESETSDKWGMIHTAVNQMCRSTLCKYELLLTNLLFPKEN